MKNLAPRTARLAGAGAAAFILALAAPAVAWADDEVGPEGCSSTASGLGPHTFQVGDSGCDSADEDDNTVTVESASVTSGVATVSNTDTSVTVAGLPNDVTGDVVVTAIVTDPDGPTAEWRITVTLVAEEPDATAVADTNTVTAGKSVAGNVTGNDKDANGWDAVLDAKPTKGSVSLNPSGAYTYKANAGTSGTDTFTYHLIDGDKSSNTATVTITIKATGGGGGDDGDDGDDNNNGGDDNTGDNNNGDDTTAKNDKDKLAKTGMSLTSVAVTGAGALGAGAVALWFSRRRKETGEI